MSYHYDKKKKHKKRRGFVFALVILALLFTPLLQYVYDILEQPFARAAHNVAQGGKQIALLVDATRFSKRELLDHNAALQTEIHRLMAAQEQVDFYAKYSGDMETDGNVIFTHIINRSLLNTSHLMVNRGSDDGVAVGDSVLAFGSILLGQVVEVFDTTSRVVLYTEPSQSQAGILFPHDIPVQLDGYGTLNYVMEIDRSIEVLEGDIVYSEALPGYSMARVRSVQFDPRNPFKKVILSPSVNVNETTLLQIKKTTHEA